VVARDTDVVRESRDDFEQSVDEGLASGASLAFSEVHADQELSGRDRRDGDVVVVRDDAVEVLALSLGANEEGGVKEQQAQGRSSRETDRRTSSTSRAH
jgi:hypothetical protein